MSEERKTIKELKKLKEAPVRKEFLLSLRSKLKEYMSYYPVREAIQVPAVRKPVFVFGHLSALKATALLLIVVLLFGGGGVAWASQISLPGEALYPVKVFTEGIQESLTFDADKKARLQTSFTKKRIAEMEKLLKEKGVEAPGLNIAQERLESHAIKAANIVKSEAEEGKEVSELAAVMVDSFRLRREEAKRIFKEAKEELKTERRQLHGELLAAIEMGDTGRVEQLRGDLAHLGALKDEAESRKKAAVQVLKAEKYTLHDQLREKKRLEVEARNKAEAIEEARAEALEAVEEAGERAADEAEEALEEVRSILQEDLIIDEVGDLPALPAQTGQAEEEPEQAAGGDIIEERVQPISAEEEAVIDSIDEIIDFGIDEAGLESFLEDIDDFDAAVFGI